MRALLFLASAGHEVAVQRHALTVSTHPFAFLIPFSVHSLTTVMGLARVEGQGGKGTLLTKQFKHAALSSVHSHGA